MKLKTLKPRVPTQAGRLPVLVPGSWRSDKQGANARGYTYRWQQYRLGWLRQHPLCGDRVNGASAEHSLCVRAGRAVPATAVDHIEPHRGDQALFWDPNNHQSLCGHCHDSVKAQIERSGRDQRGLPLDPSHQTGQR